MNKPGQYVSFYFYERTDAHILLINQLATFLRERFGRNKQEKCWSGRVVLRIDKRLHLYNAFTKQIEYQFKYPIEPSDATDVWHLQNGNFLIEDSEPHNLVQCAICDTKGELLTIFKDANYSDYGCNSSTVRNGAVLLAYDDDLREYNFHTGEVTVHSIGNISRVVQLRDGRVIATENHDDYCVLSVYTPSLQQIKTIKTTHIYGIIETDVPGELFYTHRDQFMRLNVDTEEVRSFKAGLDTHASEMLLMSNGLIVAYMLFKVVIIKGDAVIQSVQIKQNFYRELFIEIQGCRLLVGNNRGISVLNPNTGTIEQQHMVPDNAVIIAFVLDK